MRLTVFLFALPLLAQIHIDAGSSADKNFSGGWAYQYPDVPAGGYLPTMRYGNFSYSFPVLPGDYTVTLTFIERIVTTVGAHVFNVSINGAVVLPNFDLFALAGSGVPVMRTFPVRVAISPLTITFSTVTRNASVNMIDVAPVPPAPPPPPSPAYLSGLLTTRPAACPTTGLTFFTDTQNYELYWCLSPGGWIKATSKDIVLGTVHEIGTLKNGLCAVFDVNGWRMAGPDILTDLSGGRITAITPGMVLDGGDCYR